MGLGLEYGILLGILVNVMFILHNTARPTSKIETIKIKDNQILLITPCQSLPFSAAEYIRYKILKHAINSEGVNMVIVNGESIQEIDMTVALNLKAVADDLKIQNKDILFWNFRAQPVGVAHRLNSDFGKLFKHSDKIEDLNCLITEDNVITVTT